MTNPATEALVLRILADHDHQDGGGLRWSSGEPTDRAQKVAARIARELSEIPVDGKTSDGHHTFDELYDYRMAYHAHAAAGWAAAGIPVVKSLRHSDGELCFGGGWFIVVADLPTGQVSNHYREEHWALFDVPEVDLPSEYDGHTPADALQRLLDARVAPVAPSEDRAQEIAAALVRTTELTGADAETIARAALALAVLPVVSPELVERGAKAAWEYRTSLGPWEQGAEYDREGTRNQVRLALEAALAASPAMPVVNEAKLAEFIAEELLTDDAVSEGWSLQKVGATARRLAKFAVAERRHEWLGVSS